MFYKLAPYLRLCGFKGLPFAVYDMQRGHTSFLERDMFRIIYSCDSKHDIDPEALNDDEKKFFNFLLETKRIMPCEEREGLLPYQEYREYDNYYKETVHWSITGDCNYRCKHCFMSAPEAKFGIPTKKQLLDIIDDMEEVGIRGVGITGGEPLIRDDFFEIIDKLQEKLIHIDTIYTNGALVDRKFMEKLKERGVYCGFQISMDGLGCHDWIRGVEGAEEKAWNAMKLIKEYGYGFSCSMVLHKKNVNSIRKTVLALKEAGCSSLKINVASDLGCWTKQGDYALTSEEGYQAYLDYIPEYLEDDCPVTLMLEGTFVYDKGAEFAKITCDKSGYGAEYECANLCGAVRKNMYLSPEGKVLPCMSMIGVSIADQFPNAFETPLKEILTDSTYCTAMRCKVRDLVEKHPECKTCEYIEKCHGGCRAIAVQNGSTDYLEPEEELCHFFKDGWYDKFTAAIEDFNEKLKVKLEEKSGDSDKESDDKKSTDTKAD